MKIALVHDYLTQKGGAERVFELLCSHFPSADIFTSLYDPKRTIELGDRTVNTSILQKIPGAKKYFRLMAPFYYPVFRSLNLKSYDLVISSSTSFAKSVRTRTDAQHICFCHNVTRFLWDTETYLREYSDYQQFYPLIEYLFRMMRRVDRTYAQEPNLYIANSTIVAERIQDTYSKDAIVVHYPIDSSKFTFSKHKEDYYLVSSRLISYKKIDLTIEAFNQLGLPLIIIGDGPERKILESKAAPNIKFLGHVSDIERGCLMARARSVVVAALEDYGLVPIEANASGTPVIAFGAGGVLDTQIPSKTAVLFKHQNSASIQDAVLESRAMDWDYKAIRDHALTHFSETVFFDRINQIIDHFAGRSYNNHKVAYK
jgi:glycosyltransferase involved in cell wall biosynthesis